MIVNAGRAVISARLYGTASAAFAPIGIGTGVTAAAATDTTLQTEVKADGTAAAGVHAIATAAVTASSITGTVANDTAQFAPTTPLVITSAIAWTECALFNADTNGTMLCRQTFSVINLASGDSISPTWKIKNA